ncbi:XRE family transcriptional regulator [Thalassotalea sp. 42_200_T64]|nr:XRE family transcriptional regulator [Thalassotalea sp. 42_200_T64]
MSQIKQISDVLKTLLKQQQLTYADVAEQLKMSEANIKRIFSNESFSLQRLESICQLMDLSLTDLFLLIERQQEKISQLTLEQEQELVHDPKLLLVAACVRDGWSFEEIITHYQIDQFAAIRLLVRLDKLKMIQLLPNNQYKLLISQDFKWQHRGPLERFISQDVMAKFLMSDFASEDSFRFYIRGSYSQNSIATIFKKLKHLTQECAELNHQDAQLPLSKRQHIGVLTAMRPWELSLFKEMRREQS